MSELLSNLQVEQAHDGSYQLSWLPTRESHTFSIQARRAPQDELQLQFDVCSSHGSLCISPTEEFSRLYFIIDFPEGRQFTAANRHIPLEGGRNFRDLGGYRNSSGQTVRWGKLYRSGHLANLSESDLKKVAQLGITTIVDFRVDEERNKKPNRCPANQPTIQAIAVEPGCVDQFYARIVEGDFHRRYVTEFMESINRDLVRSHSPEYRKFFATICNNQLCSQGQPLLMHCAAGKDRTGFGAAMLLAALGVDEATIMEDYLLSNEYIKTEADSEKVAQELSEQFNVPVNPQCLIPMFQVKESYLATALEEIDLCYGSIDAYLEKELGVDDQMRSLLCASYLE